MGRRHTYMAANSFVGVSTRRVLTIAILMMLPAQADGLALEGLRASKSGKVRLGIFQIEGPKAQAELLVDAAATALSKLKRLEVVTKKDIERMLDFERERALMECTDEDKCLSQIAGAFGVDYLISGSFNPLQGAQAITLQLMDTQRAEGLRREVESWDGAEAELVHLVSAMAVRLVVGNKELHGSVLVNVDQEDARVRIDGVEVGRSPMKLAWRAPVGKRTLEISKSGFVTHVQRLVVPYDERRVFNVRLKVEEQRWYQAWWVWVIGGVAVGGAAAAAAVVATRDSRGQGTFVIDPVEELR